MKRRGKLLLTGQARSKVSSAFNISSALRGCTEGPRNLTLGKIDNKYLYQVKNFTLVARLGKGPLVDEFWSFIIS